MSYLFVFSRRFVIDKLRWYLIFVMNQGLSIKLIKTNCQKGFTFFHRVLRKLFVKKIFTLTVSLNI